MVEEGEEERKKEEGTQKAEVRGQRSGEKWV